MLFRALIAAAGNFAIHFRPLVELSLKLMAIK
jgi:hypothetical protein